MLDTREWTMVLYCAVTFGLATLAFGLRYLLLQDAAKSRLSKAQEYVPPVEIAAWVLVWYGVSVSMVVANRWLFHGWQGKGFPFPVLTTMFHMWLKVVFSRVVIYLQDRKPPKLDASIHYWTIIPIGLSTAGDILLSNVSYMFATMIFYTIVKSGSLMWILMWSVVFRFEVLTCKTFTVVLGICVGLLLASLGATDFSWRALVLILGASCLSGLRWSFVQFLQAVESSCTDPLLVIYYIAPTSALVMTPMALFDLLKEDVKSTDFTTTSTIEVVLLIVVTGMSSFALIFAEVKLLTLSSSLTMGVFGTLKESVQVPNVISMIILAILVLGEEMTWMKSLGLVMAMIFTLTYKLTRSRPHANVDLRGKNAQGHAEGRGSSSADGKGRSTGLLLSYSAVSQQEVDEELRVFQYSTEMELEEELEEFRSYREEGERVRL